MGVSADIIKIPSWFSEIPNSFSEQHIPFEATPRIFAGFSISVFPV